MGQVPINLDAESEAKARHHEQIMNIFLDKWIAGLVMEKTSELWPESVRILAGSWQDFPALEEIRTETAKDIQRECL